MEKERPLGSLYNARPYGRAFVYPKIKKSIWGQLMKDKTWEEMDRKFKKRMAENKKKLAKQRKDDEYKNRKKRVQLFDDDRQITMADYGFNAVIQLGLAQTKRLGDRNE